jgi:hypothetical protein
MRILCLLLLTGLSGCHLIKVNSNVKMRSNIMGEKTSLDWQFKGTLDELPAALEQAYDALSRTADKLIDKIKRAAAAPPPGTVRLRDLSRRLKRYEGTPNVDFLSGKEARSKRFKYVRIGVANYDNFFKAAMEFYALAWQTAQSAHRIRQLSGALLEEEVDTDGAVYELMLRALKVPTTPTNTAIKSKLKALRASTGVLADLLPAFVKKTRALVSTGHALIAGAPASITHPKVVLHLGLIKQGLEESIGVLTESAGLLKTSVEDLSGF